MTETPWSDVDLNILSTRSAPDWSLERLVIYADVGFDTGVTVVVGGTLISGTLTSERRWGEGLDEDLAEAMSDRERHYRDAAEGGGTPENVDALFERIRHHSFAGTAEEKHAEAVRLYEELPEGGPADLPRDQSRRAVADLYGPAAFTLDRASILIPMRPPLEIGRLRVLLAHVGAWWLGTMEPAQPES